ncbi:lactonase family protein [Lacihabitans sp. LS3-19]|uniref:lactonase family protein n=1 Tax=Lacihabitans sp. LS3-19 TaxID=2487335 RepID=UPI0020CD6783|nr:lactonase family protein [Lacihabitans sp. LS3-19]MCP9770387.1 lactonase family protein [Lacihabitans sp. LS3-19]
MIKYLILVTSMLFLASCSSQKTEEIKNDTYEFLVGTYSKNKSQGIYFCSFDPASGETKIISASDTLDNPSFLTISDDQKHVYTVCETDGGSAEALNFDRKTGKFDKLNIQNSGGAHPCHIALDKTGKWIFTGNYTGGTVGVLAVNADGTLGEVVQTIQQTGTGPNKGRQEKSHVHSVNISPDNKNLYVANLGTDELYNYSFDEQTGKLTESQRIHLSAGSGPRHFEFHPTLPFAYVIQELTGKVTQFKIDSGNLTVIEEVSTLPVDFTGDNACADIHISPDGMFLYGSNRFLDTIVSFSIDSKTGKLSQLSQTPVNGEVPRNFGISPDGKYIFVANQKTDNIVVFERNQKTGALTSTGKEFKISMPVCIKFL